MAHARPSAAASLLACGCRASIRQPAARQALGSGRRGICSGWCLKREAGGSSTLVAHKASVPAAAAEHEDGHRNARQAQSVVTRPLLRKVQGHELALELAGVAGFEPAASSSRSQVPVRPLEVDSGSGHVGPGYGPIGSVLPVLSSSQDAPQHNPRCRAPDPSGLPPKPGGSADGLPIAQAYATRASIAFTAA
jgi:hypothetical protein